MAARPPTFSHGVSGSVAIAPIGNPGLQEMKALSITRTASILEDQRCLSSSLLMASLEAAPTICSWI
jgi:hypothetical protein